MVSRTILIRVATPYNNCVEFLEQFTTNFWTFNQDNTITSLAVDDIDDYNYKSFTNINEIKEILRLREYKGLMVSVVLWEIGFESSIHLRIKKIESAYKNITTHYELDFDIGYGKRIKNANRYTDYGYYLNLLLPKLLEMECCICEITCHDYDC